ncbi:MAG: glutamate-1-semialdehyde 2,1-aminomutase [Ignavibacteria bacterium]|nr:glutamate-1-semialdehyde 2,1-aminomutase [Ignavibacteria bacterium]
MVQSPRPEEVLSFKQSLALQQRFQRAIPGGGHTYAKGDDQFPEHMPPYIVRGKGCHVWDADENEYIEFGMGLRAVTLGHAFEPVIEASRAQMLHGSNFVRPATIELECAEEFLSIVTGAEMVKFGKNGSDATSAAIKLARAYTGRDMVAVCAEHPFFSVDDWFICTTAMDAGIPSAIKELTVKFHYNNIENVEELFHRYPSRIACVILEPEKEVPPQNDFLHKLKDLCHTHGAVFILDEMINGFRWHIGGGQAFHNIIPDLSAFGKALGNGFSISALAGKREIMRLGGLDHDRERVFLLSLTHGAESHSLAAALAVMKTYKSEPVVETMWNQGKRLAAIIEKTIDELHLQGFVEVIGRPCALVLATRDEHRKPSQPFRTLFLQETIRRGVLAPSFVVSYAHNDEDIDRTGEVVYEALCVYRKALDEGVGKYLVGRPVKPVFRKYR